MIPEVEMSRFRIGLLGALLMTLAAPAVTNVGSLIRAASRAQASGTVVVRLGANAAKDAVDGRLLLLFSKDPASEPRFQVSATSLSSAQIFGVDVDGLKAGDERTFDASVLGYPLESLSELQPGEYTVQGLLHK